MKPVKWRLHGRKIINMVISSVSYKARERNVEGSVGKTQHNYGSSMNAKGSLSYCTPRYRGGQNPGCKCGVLGIHIQYVNVKVGTRIRQ